MGTCLLEEYTDRTGLWPHVQWPYKGTCLQIPWCSLAEVSFHEEGERLSCDSSLLRKVGSWREGIFFSFLASVIC